MRINIYGTKLDDNRINVLVKEKAVNYDIDNLLTPESVFYMMNALFDMQNLTEEFIYMIACNSKQKIVGIFEISHGTVNTSLVSPREVFVRALLCGAVTILLVHNHPSGDIKPSTEDYTVTQRMKACGKLLNIQLLDHVIIGYNYFSFRQNTNKW